MFAMPAGGDAGSSLLCPPAVLWGWPLVLLECQVTLQGTQQPG